MVLVEPISLTISAVALASLFSLCVECFDLIEVGRNLGADYDLLIIKLSIEKRRLMIWGEAVGILRPDMDRDLLLDEPETRQLVERILEGIQKLFHEADALKSKYGLDKVSNKQNPSSAGIEGSVICSSSFESSPLVQFQTRFSEFHRKTGLRAKSRWAIRDFSKFTGLIQNLKDLLDGLNQITTSTRTTILKGNLVRRETEAIPDLRTLKIIGDTCSDADWKSSAGAASSYLTNLNRITDSKRAHIREWMDIDQDQGSSPQILTSQQDWRGQQYQNTIPGGIYGGIHQFSSTSPYYQGARRLQPLDHPYDKELTETLVICSTSALVAWIPNADKYFYPVECVPEITAANRITCSRMMKAIVVPSGVRSPCIAIYCPPRMRYVYMALSILNPRSAPQYRFIIRFDDRLLDWTTSFSGIPERMKGYHRELEDSIDTRDPTLRNIVNAIDMNWLEQRLDVMSQSSYQPLSDTLDWHTVFRQSRDDTPCVGIIIMAGQAACWDLFNTTPVAPPDTFRDGRIYRLRELEDTAIEPDHRWKAEHYCNISNDKDFDMLEEFDSRQAGRWA